MKMNKIDYLILAIFMCVMIVSGLFFMNFMLANTILRVWFIIFLFVILYIVVFFLMNYLGLFGEDDSKCKSKR